MNNKKLQNKKEKENNIKKQDDKKPKNKIFTKKNILLFFIPIFIFINIYLINNSPQNLELKRQIEKLKSRIQKLEKEIVKKKVKIGLVYENIYLNGIAKFLIVLGDLLVKTGKYDVYLINEVESKELDFKYNKKIKRHIIEREIQSMKDFDEENDIDIYIINNDLTEIINIYHSFGKKVIGVYHGDFLSCAFQNETIIYRSWQYFKKLDVFVHIIPDDYWIYKKFGFNNTIYIPNVYTFESKNTPSSPLTYKNILMAEKVDNIIKGAEYGLYAMTEIVKEIPDARLTIIGMELPQHLKDLIKELKIQDNVNYLEFSTNITEYYLNTSVLLVTSLGESCPMIMDEGKAHGLPIVAFDVDYCPCYQSGLIKVKMFDHFAMAKETIKLLKNYEYRKEKGEEAKLSLNNYETNDEKIEMWDNLFQAIINGTEDFNKLQKKVEKKNYNETLAKEHIEKHFYYAQQFNKYFRCHSFEDFTNLKYLNKIEICKI